MFNSYKILWNYNVIKWLPYWYFVSSQNFLSTRNLRESKCNGTSQIRQFFCRLTNFMSIKFGVLKHHMIQKLQRHCGIMVWFLSRHVWKHFFTKKMDFLCSKLVNPCLWSVIYVGFFCPKYRIEGVKTLNPSALLPKSPD